MVKDLTSTEKTTIHYEGESFLIDKEASEDQIRAALQKAGIPEAANARITQDTETGEWTVTREAGQKGF
jgi:hypothetical protein